MGIILNLTRLEVALTGVEDGLDLLHGEVDQQAEQSSLLQKKLLLTEERGKERFNNFGIPKTCTLSLTQRSLPPQFAR